MSKIIWTLVILIILVLVVLSFNILTQEQTEPIDNASVNKLSSGTVPLSLGDVVDRFNEQAEVNNAS